MRPSTGLALSALALAIAAAPSHAAAPQAITPHWMELTGLLPAPTYDPRHSQIPRRRPGHPYVPYSEPDPQNPDAVDPAPVDMAGEFLPVPDRWRIMEGLGFKHPWFDPYNQNVLKGDKPIRGEDEFLSLTLIADTIVEPRSIPTPVGPQSTTNPGSLDVLGDIDQLILAQTLIFSADYYIGNTTFKPPENEYRATLALNYNRVHTEEVRALQIDPSLGTTRDDAFLGVQELFWDHHLRDVSSRYDFDSFRIGIQPFNSDFRGFLFQDSQPGIRFFGNRDNNRWQYNIAWFRRLNKDLNSGLNDVTRRWRDDDILIANLYRQDWPKLGFTSQVTAVYNRNREDTPFFDSNGFIQRPSSLGGERPRTYDVGYVGYNGDGHFGRWNLTVSAYAAVGRQSPGTFIAGDTDIRAGFFAAEVSRDFDWIRVRGSLAYASGDDDAFDDKSTGYDAIFENPIFAGADTSYWIRQNVPLIGGGGVALAQRNGLLANLRSSKELGQSNFDNPGLRLIGIGADFDLTPQSRLSGNLNHLWFDKTEILETARNQGGIGRSIGTDVSVAYIWRPFMTQNIVLRLSGAALLPGDGFKDLYGDRHSTYYSVLGNFIFTF
ncbi:hypothetical protein [Tahibacter amnicola]|uniref:Alginate export protein n=1 Tax=Tahibacter amnicola TaxID=2976241 RepID=A0ABY6BKM1_9GAMM|nr:hypothetical protein [Tahibacter amnicola]UXI70322.1 hypothetical protein N4264_12005 [Tahibacter amnicola]